MRSAKPLRVGCASRRTAGAQSSTYDPARRSEAELYSIHTVGQQQRMRHTAILTAAALAIGALVSVASCARTEERVLTVSGSAVGREGELLRAQIERFRRSHQSLTVALRPTPDAADQRHQLYVQWLNARAADPDVLQLDVVWTAEFAAAGWIASLERFHPRVNEFFTAAVAAERWMGVLYALPWFVDVGMLYRRTDLVPSPPRDLAELVRLAKRARNEAGVPYGLVWQGARYEGLVTVFVEHLGAFGGTILDDRGRVTVDSDAAEQALTYMRDAIYADGIVPAAALTWQEEQTRLAFQSGQAAFMRNWPYAYALVQDGSQSSVAGRVAVTAMPAAPGGTPTAALGGSALAINAYSDQPVEAYELIDYLLQPEQMMERAQIAGQYPTRPSLYTTATMAEALKIAPADLIEVIAGAVPRPITPVYHELSQILQISLHRALTRQQEPRPALQEAAAAMRALLTKAKLAPDAS
jgi:multiple sugar transport system substrate-binding protein